MQDLFKVFGPGVEIFPGVIVLDTTFHKGQGTKENPHPEGQIDRANGVISHMLPNGQRCHLPRKDGDWYEGFRTGRDGNLYRIRWQTSPHHSTVKVAVVKY